MPKKTLSTGDRIAVVAMSSSSSSSLPPVASAIAVVIRHGRRSSSRLACSIQYGGALEMAGKFHVNSY